MRPSDLVICPVCGRGSVAATSPVCPTCHTNCTFALTGSGNGDLNFFEGFKGFAKRLLSRIWAKERGRLSLPALRALRAPAWVRMVIVPLVFLTAFSIVGIHWLYGVARSPSRQMAKAIERGWLASPPKVCALDFYDEYKRSGTSSPGVEAIVQDLERRCEVVSREAFAAAQSQGEERVNWRELLRILEFLYDRRSGGSPELRAHLALCRAEQLDRENRDITGATEELRKAILLNPNWPLPYFTLGRIYAQKGPLQDLDRADFFLTKAIDLEPAYRLARRLRDACQRERAQGAQR